MSVYRNITRTVLEWHSVGRCSGATFNLLRSYSEEVKRQSKGRIRTNSRFQKAPETKHEAVKEINNHPEYVKSPEVIRKEIKEKYGDKVPELFIEDMIQESQELNRSLLLNTREDGSFDLQKYQQDDINGFVEYVGLVVDRFNKETGLEETDAGEDQGGFFSKLSSMLSPENLSANLDSLTDKMALLVKPSLTEDLVALFKSIAQNIKKSNKDIPLNLQSDLFNCAIRLPPGPDQDLCLYILGNLIYLNRGLRLDPFNEARYINALLKRGNYIQLEYLWSSRRGKDVKGQRFWDELGILIYITSKNLRALEQLAKEILSRYGYVLPVSLIELVKLHLTQGLNKRLLLDWVDVFDNIGLEHGYEQTYSVRQVEMDLSNTENDQDGFAVLNLVEKIGFDDVYNLIAAYLNVAEYEASVNLSVKYTKLVPGIEDFLVYKFSQLPEMIQAGLFYYLTSDSKAKSLVQSLEPVLNITQKSELELKQMIFKRLLQRKSPLLNVDDFESELTSEDCYSIIKDFTNRGMHREVNEMLGYMQEVKLAKDRGDTAKYVLPPVSSVHYIPILQKLGRHKSKDVILRAGKLLEIMNKVGVRRGQYFHTQFLLTLYRKRQFQICIDYLRSNFIERRQYTKSFVLLDTMWIIYRDANRNGMRPRLGDLYDLTKYTLKCYRDRPPSATSISLVMEALLSTQNFALLLSYIQALRPLQMALDSSGFLKVLKILLDLSKRASVRSTDPGKAEVQVQLVELIERYRVSLLTKSKDKTLKVKYQSYDLEMVYYLVYRLYNLFWDADMEQLESELQDLSEKWHFEYTRSKEIVENFTNDRDAL